MHNQILEKAKVQRRNLEIILDDECELVVGARPPGLQPLRLQASVGSAVVHDLSAEFPAKAINEIENVPGGIEVPVNIEGGFGRDWEVVDEDVEVDGVVIVVGGGERVEAAGEGGEAVVGEDFDDEGCAMPQILKFECCYGHTYAPYISVR
nr:hypothetical protein PanWU01x14_053230 [Ipomoea trifida]